MTHDERLEIVEDCKKLERYCEYLSIEIETVKRKLEKLFEIDEKKNSKEGFLQNY